MISIRANRGQSLLALYTPPAFSKSLVCLLPTNSRKEWMRGRSVRSGSKCRVVRLTKCEITMLHGFSEMLLKLDLILTPRALRRKHVVAPFSTSPASKIFLLPKQPDNRTESTQTLKRVRALPECLLATGVTPSFASSARACWPAYHSGNGQHSAKRFQLIPRSGFAHCPSAFKA